MLRVKNMKSRMKGARGIPQGDMGELHCMQSWMKGGKGRLKGNSRWQESWGNHTVCREERQGGRGVPVASKVAYTRWPIQLIQIIGARAKRGPEGLSIAVLYFYNQFDI